MGYYVWNVLFPMGAFSFLAFLAFLYEAEQWYERSTHDLNVILGFITFKFVIGESMPKLPFFVLLDLYLFPNFIFLSAMLAEVGAIKFLFLIGVFEKGSRRSRIFDIQVAACLFGVWLVAHVIFVVRFRAIDGQQRRTLGK